MSIKKFKPTTPGLRQMSMASFEEITKTTPEKSLTVSLKRHAGRNNVGRITARHRGSGAKRLYRMVDFKRIDKSNIEGRVTAIEYDPYRTAYIMLVQYKDGEKRYHLAPDGIKVGEKLMTALKAKIKPGNRMQIKNIPVGFFIHDVELYKDGRRGGQVGRSAGSFAKLVSLEGQYAQIEMPSKEGRLVDKNCYATVGIVSNLDHSNITIGKAGRKRHMGRRPEVRGKAMNPCDHPHGGGEGGSSIGLKYPKTPWGLHALGVRTRKHNKTNRLIVKSRHAR